MAYLIFIIIAFLLVCRLFSKKNGNADENFTFDGRPQSYELRIRLVDIHLGENGDGPPAKRIEAKGLFPLTRKKKVGFLTSVFDKTSGNLEPVHCFIKEFQEPRTIAYQHLSSTGEVSPGGGFLDWVGIGLIIPDVMHFPYSGNRNVVVMVRMVDLDNMPDIFLGFRTNNDSGILWNNTLEFGHNFTDKGYEEEARDRDEATAISIKIAIAVAMADGSLDDSEGKVIKKWVTRVVDTYKNKDKREHFRKVYNSAMKEAYRLSLNGNLSLSDLTSRLNDIADKSTRYKTIELCQEIMVADGIADRSELEIIKKIAEALELDQNEVKKTQQEKILKLNKTSKGQSNIEEILGIDRSFDTDKIKKHLRIEFQKWNNRLNTLSPGKEREEAQQMLDWIAEARKKYV